MHPAFMAICKDNNSLSVEMSHWIRTKGKNGSIQHARKPLCSHGREGNQKEVSNRDHKANQREAHKNTDPSSQQPLLEMQIIRDHLIVPDTGMDRLSQREPSNWQHSLSLSLGHPRTASVLSATSPRPPTQTFNPWRRPEANSEQGVPE